MSVSRVLNVLNGDLISRFREFLIAFWQHASLKALLAPVARLDESGTTMEVIEDPAELEVVNPFIPLMLSNSAALVGELILSHPKGRLGVILRTVN